MTDAPPRDETANDTPGVMTATTRDARGATTGDLPGDTSAAARDTPGGFADTNAETAGVAALAAFLARAAAIVGAEHVSGPDAVDDYLDVYALGDPHAHQPGGAVRPAEVDQVQEVVRAANEFGVALWPVGRGKNLGYGGSAPRQSGTVVLDLGRMNRVLEVDDETASAIVEPGVSFFDLYEELRSRDSRLWASVPDLGWGSVVGNALERGYGYTAHGDHQQFICGLEVVLPTGELIRTGMGAMPNSEAWPLYRGGFGPGFEGLFLQSNLGIVTKMGIWLMPRPERFAACRVAIDRESSLPALVDAMRELGLEGMIDGVVNAANAVGVAAGSSSRERWYDGDGVVPDEIVDTIASDLGIGRWNVKFAVYGSDAMLDLKLARIEGVLAGIPGSRLTAHRYDGAASAEEVEPFDHFAAGIPGMLLAGGVRWRADRPTGAHIGLCPVSPLTGRHVVEAGRVMRTHIEAAGFDYIGGWLGTGRHAVNVLMIFFDAADAEESARVKRAFGELVPLLADAGYGEYRAHLEFMDAVASRFDFNDSSLLHFTRTLKRAVDPRGILAPGKQGVWPL
ncbi:FAD-binding oxidoreductase [Herbiconiux sp. KACC 21604]|uniref:FAD-binding oxidoreductase n=1 Tax=unclassified Herbiconiux TaxID=2618217 RepID=UPI001492AA5E|nr:FAD-binding oxidoreductase [Herbiconiux sp. SALV-R1]QJU54112.1 FAD-binding oxidoreductase [Herbiconiux sp. SALV-R1]WPO85163.1 FAD-binding oxidoreductase [Herbiconiux sp. KACC 21604]